MKSIFSLGLCLVVFTGLGAREARAANEKPALVVNKLELTQEELKKEYETSLLLGHPQQEAAAGEPEWVSRIIERELLVQEAQKLGLHRNPEFMHAVERFWKEVLIKTLLDKKADEIADGVHIHEPEIEGYYQKLAAENPEKQVEPLIALREEIERDIRQQKESEALEAWIQELRNQSKIVIEREAFKEIES